jgi:hypothetical protein
MMQPETAMDSSVHKLLAATIDCEIRRVLCERISGLF